MLRFIAFIVTYLLFYSTPNADDYSTEINSFCNHDNGYNCILFKSLFQPILVINKDGVTINNKTDLGSLKTYKFFESRPEFIVDIGNYNYSIFINAKESKYESFGTSDFDEIMRISGINLPFKNDYNALRLGARLNYREFKIDKISIEVLDDALKKHKQNLTSKALENSIPDKNTNIAGHKQEIKRITAGIETFKKSSEKFRKDANSQIGLLRSICSWKPSGVYCDKHLLGEKF